MMKNNINKNIIKDKKGITMGLLIIIVMILATLLSIVTLKVYERSDINLLQSVKERIGISNSANKKTLLENSIARALSEAIDSGKFENEEISEISDYDLPVKLENYLKTRTKNIIKETNELSDKELTSLVDNNIKEAFKNATGKTIEEYSKILKLQMN